MNSTPTDTHEEWLRRLSDYHSGDGSPEERAQVEAHLRDCVRCQQAFTAYQRLYALASSPLRLGAPSVALARQDTAFPRTVRRSTSMQQTPSSSSPTGWDDHTTQPSLISASPIDLQRNTQPPNRRSRWGGIAAALVAAALIIAFVATLGPRFIGQGSKGPKPTVTAGATQTAHPNPSVTSNGSPTPIPAPKGFVCANAPGSNATYAFINADGQVYSVTGCSTPRKLTNIPIPPNSQGVIVSPFYLLGFSPSNTLLMLTESNQSDGSSCQVIANTQTKTLLQTSLCIQSLSANWSTWPEFIGWESDTSFLEANFHTDSSVTVAQVNASTFAETAIAKFRWVANLARYNSESGIVLRNGALFYAGYATGSTTQAALHRYTLATGADTQIVPLGTAGTGGCQVSSGPCGWTGPWDVTPDGSHVIYHNPGPQISLTDTINPPDTALYYAKSDGSGAVKLFDALSPPGNSSSSLIPTSPVVAPDGRYAASSASGYSSAYADRVCSLAAPGDGSIIMLPVSEKFSTWRSDSAAFVVVVLSAASSSAQYAENAVYTLSTGKITPLTTNTTDYLWGN